MSLQFLAPSLPSDMPAPRTPRAPSKLFETRSHAWREAGLLRQIDARVVRRARLEAFVLIPLFVAVVVVYDNRKSVFGSGIEASEVKTTIQIAVAIALLILGWAIARDVGRALGIRKETLLAGSAFTAVILGLAAQQTLGNLFAGTVLLSARPFRVGERVRLQGGPLAGQVEGVVSSLGLLYTTFATGEDSIMVPNSVVLNVAVLPLREPQAVNLRARLRPGMTPGDLQALLEHSLKTPLRESPRITLEELDGEEVVVQIATTPARSSEGRQLASELLEVVARETRSAVEKASDGDAPPTHSERSPAP